MARVAGGPFELVLAACALAVALRRLVAAAVA